MPTTGPAPVDQDMMFLILYLAMAPDEWRNQVFDTLTGYAVVVGKAQNKPPTMVLSEQRNFLADTLRGFTLELTLRMDLARTSVDKVEQYALDWLVNELSIAAGLEKADA